jgi:hypothetical protein
VEETKVELLSQLQGCDINVNDNAEEIAAKKAQEAKIGQIWKDANTVMVKNYRGKALFCSDYVLEFNGFTTVVGDVKLSDGKFYYEAEVKKIDGVMQLGFVTEGFQTSEKAGGIGVGDDDHSWGFDGIRQLVWPNKREGERIGEDEGEGEGDGMVFGTEWKIGDTVGFACDLENKSISFSVNGSFEAPNGIAFEKVNAEWLSPGLTGHGVLAVNFGDRPFRYSPPDASYVSVHSGLCSLDSRINAPGKLQLI